MKNASRLLPARGNDQDGGSALVLESVTRNPPAVKVEAGVLLGTVDVWVQQ